MSASGAGIPVIVTPVGGLSEQVEDGVTGLVAQAPSGDAIADCMRWMANDRALYSKLIVNIGNHRQDFSVTAFAEKLLSALGDLAAPEHLAPAVTERSLRREPRDLVPRTIGPALQAVNRVIRLRRLQQQTFVTCSLRIRRCKRRTDRRVQIVVNDERIADRIMRAHNHYRPITKVHWPDHVGERVGFRNLRIAAIDLPVRSREQDNKSRKHAHKSGASRFDHGTGRKRAATFSNSLKGDSWNSSRMTASPIPER